jgi:hypothetical protein
VHSLELVRIELVDSDIRDRDFKKCAAKRLSFTSTTTMAFRT